MDKEKQVEEMAEIILDVDRSYYGMECDEIQAKAEANAIYAEGYRKSADVAEEIFAEIKEMLNLQAKIVCETRDKYRETDESPLSFIAMLHGRTYSLRVIAEHIAELKKKYTEEGK